MKRSHFKSLIHQLKEQRSVFVLITIALGISNLGLVALLTIKSEKIILIPPRIQKSFWVEGSEASPSYFEEMALFFAHQLLDVTPSSAAYQREVALRYVISDSYNALKKRLLAEEERYRRENLSTSFKVCEVVINTQSKTVKLIGDLVSYVGGQKIKQNRETFIVRFRSTLGRFLVESFEVVESKDVERKNDA